MGTPIRLATFADDPGIVELLVRTWRAAYRGLVPDELIDGMSTEEMLAERRKGRQHARPERREWIATEEHAPIGYLSSGPTRDDDADRLRCAEIYSLYVDPQHWRSGVGRRLARNAIDDLRERGFEELRLWCLATNPSARDFYGAIGFEVDVDETTKRFRGFDLPHTRYRTRLS